MDCESHGSNMSRCCWLWNAFALFVIWKLRLFSCLAPSPALIASHMYWFYWLSDQIDDLPILAFTFVFLVRGGLSLFAYAVNFDLLKIPEYIFVFRILLVSAVFLVSFLPGNFFPESCFCFCFVCFPASFKFPFQAWVARESPGHTNCGSNLRAFWCHQHLDQYLPWYFWSLIHELQLDTHQTSLLNNSTCNFPSSWCHFFVVSLTFAFTFHHAYFIVHT